MRCTTPLRRRAAFAASTLLPLLLAAPSARAEEPAPAPAAAEAAPTWSEQIVVTASRGDRVVAEVPFQVVVLDPTVPTAALDLTASDLVSRQVPSLNLQIVSSSLAAAPRDQSLSFRGAGGGSVSRALLLVDGLPLLDPYNASAIWSKVPNERVERVEVVPGGGATVWGNLALSGVVNLITRPPAERTFDLAGRLGELDTRALTASYSDIAGRWAGWAALDHLASDGYITSAPDVRGPAEEAEWRDYESLSARASRELSPSASLHLRTIAYREQRGEGSRLDRAENEEWLAAAAVDLVTAADASWQLRVYGRRQALEDFTGDLSADRATVRPSSEIFDLTSESVGLSAVWTGLRRARHDLSAGVDYQALRVDRREDLEWDGAAFTERYEVAGEQQLAGGFVESRWRPAARWSLQAAARFDAVRTDGGRSRRTDLATGLQREDEELGDHREETFNPSAGFVFQATPAARLRGAAYTGFRSPVPSELFVGAAPRSNRRTVANPALEPETLVGAELGFDFTPSPRFEARLTGFWSETDGLIERLTLGRVGAAGGFLPPCGTIGPNGACQQRRNLGTTRARGVELGGGVRPHPRWRLDFAAAWLDAEVVAEPSSPGLVGNELEHTPREKATLGVTFDAPRGLVVGVRGRHLGARWAETENENRLDAHTVVDLTLTRRISPRLELFGGVENLLDESYRVDEGSRGFLYGPGRLAQAGFRYRLGG